MNTYIKLKAQELYTLGRDLDLSYEQMKDAISRYAENMHRFEIELNESENGFIQLELGDL